MVDYKGFRAIQAPNNHVIICKNGVTVLHKSYNKKKNDEELKKLIDDYLKNKKEIV